MFSDTVAFLFLLFSRLLSVPSRSGMVLSRLDTGIRGASVFVLVRKGDVKILQF